MLHILVLRDPESPTSDEVVQQLEGLKDQFPEARIRQRMLEDEPELVSRLGVMATPAVVVNGQLAFQGAPEPEFLVTYLKNVQAGLHDDPDAYPPDDERDPEARGQESTGSPDTEYKGRGQSPSFGSSPGGRH